MSKERTQEEYIASINQLGRLLSEHANGYANDVIASVLGAMFVGVLRAMDFKREAAHRVLDDFWTENENGAGMLSAGPLRTH